jgi:hypothetical protein
MAVHRSGLISRVVLEDARRHHANGCHDLCEQMNAMGAWVDDHRCGLSAFNCHQSGAGVLVSVVFTFGRGCESGRHPLRRSIDCEITVVSKRGEFRLAQRTPRDWRSPLASIQRARLITRRLNSGEPVRVAGVPGLQFAHPLPYIWLYPY